MYFRFIVLHTEWFNSLVLKPLKITLIVMYLSCSLHW